MSERKRVDVFIDGVNFHIASREAVGHAIDIGVFARTLAATIGGELGRIHFYIAEVAEDGPAREKQRKFFAALAHIPELVLVLGRHKRRERDGHAFYVEKGTDVNMAADMIAGAYENEYEIAMLVTGDTDQVRTLERTRGAGKRAVWCRVESQPRDPAMLAAAQEELVVTPRMLSMCRHRPPRRPTRAPLASLERSLESLDGVSASASAEQHSAPRPQRI